MIDTASHDAPRAAEKPLLRGVSHEIAAFVALAAWIALALVSPSARARAAANVYGASLFTLFAVSALYHRPTWPPRARRWMRRLDHSAIFLLIAGTYTPFCLVLGGARGEALLVIAWGGAALGILQSILWVRAPKPLIAVIYVLLGWVILPVMPALVARLGPGAIALLGAGGIAYSLGAVVYATRRPDPFPRVFGYHEIFHALVVVAAGLHLAVTARALFSL
ncbi:PAQR family membrane homeostasis protein TrhA [Anaeromyxobacter soli]|uniref:PAQR family membrane homeostasis protein TrhA n=1 Tax=Anaeromyxobacter soli TaxID=2922725 RepID=UPI001FAF6A36|nr:hemolysin III family protein [Anaeromyxobacter sp. SG29]